jgi:maltose alpha-D-glucosyltransferase/alpha-amylase
MEAKETTTKEIILTSHYTWLRFFDDKEAIQNLLNKILPNYLQKCRWFGGKAKKVKQFRLQHLIKFPWSDTCVYMVILEVNYVAAYSESYFLPLYFSEEESKKIDKKALIAPIQIKEKNGFLIDALYHEEFRTQLFRHIVLQKQIPLTEESALKFEKGSILNDFDSKQNITSYVLKADQSNTSIIYNERFFLKIYRNLFRDTNPDYETTRFLTENSTFKNSPTYAGSITWKRQNFFDVSFGLMQEKVENEGDAWKYFNEKVKLYFTKIQQHHQKDWKNISDTPLYEPHSIRELEPELVDLIGYDTLKSVEKLAQRTAEMHIAISSDRSNLIFMPVLYNQDYAVWLKNRLMYQFDRRIDLIEKNIEELEGLAKEYAIRFLENKENIINIILNFDEQALISKRVRIHGDYHLGQVLKKGDDFVILDFEGEPESTIRDRKVKQPPLKDVAGMLRSFHYAIYANIFEQLELEPQSFEMLQETGRKYYDCIVAIFLNTYINVAMDKSLDIGYYAEIKYLLKYHLLEKAIYELGYELNSRPAWAIIPLKGIMDLLDSI